MMETIKAGTVLHFKETKITITDVELSNMFFPVSTQVSDYETWLVYDRELANGEKQTNQRMLARVFLNQMKRAGLLDKVMEG